LATAEWLDGAGWHVELFREIAVQRDFALAYIDPSTGGLEGGHLPRAVQTVDGIAAWSAPIDGSWRK
jgi:hypothetical protein